MEAKDWNARDFAYFHFDLYNKESTVFWIWCISYESGMDNFMGIL